MKINADVRGTLGAVRDQGARPTCLAHATSAGHECARGQATFVSPEYLYQHARVAGQSGLGFNRVAASLLAEGQPLDTDSPYSTTEPSTWAAPKGVRVFRRASAARNATLAAVSREIAAGNAPILGLTLTESFYRPAAPWIIRPTGRRTGRHAVTAVATASDGSANYVLVRNSWGESWGLRGHAWLGEDYLSQFLHCVLVIGAEV